MDKSKIKVFLSIEIVLHSLALLFMKIFLEMNNYDFGSELCVIFLTFNCILPLYSVITGLIIVFFLKTMKSYLLGIIVTAIFSMTTAIVIFGVYGIYNAAFIEYRNLLFLYLGILVITYGFKYYNSSKCCPCSGKQRQDYKSRCSLCYRFHRLNVK